jgi:predicted DNA binding CopG/RHH family protein
MSTNAIREVLGEIRRTHSWDRIDDALAEVEAIERAAQAWLTHERRESMRVVDEVLTSIAKETSK